MKFWMPQSMTDWYCRKKRQICPVMNCAPGAGHFKFDLSWASRVRLDWPPHLKINLKLSSNYGRSLMFSSKIAQFLLNSCTIFFMDSMAIRWKCVSFQNLYIFSPSKGTSFDSAFEHMHKLLSFFIKFRSFLVLLIFPLLVVARCSGIAICSPFPKEVI